MKLSILICTLPERVELLKRLTNILNPQLKDDCEILVNSEPRSVPTGTKRNKLITESQGEYFSFIDDDDTVPIYYVNEILNALNQNPDCVTFNGRMTTDGAHEKKFTIRLGSEYVDRHGMYYRWPNHICVMKKSVVQNIKFPDKWIGEDYDWSKRIRDLGLLKSEVHLPIDMYRYDFITRKPKNGKPY